MTRRDLPPRPEMRPDAQARPSAAVTGPAAQAAVRAPSCPFCDSPAVELVSPWGGQSITAQWRCLACSSYFEAIRDAFDDDAPAAGPRLSG